MTDALIDRARYWSKHDEVPFVLQHLLVDLIARLEAAEKVCLAVEDEERVLESDDWSAHTNFYNLMRERLGAWRAARDAQGGTP